MPRTGILALLALVCAGLLASSAQAAALPSKKVGQLRADVQSYWTPARMRSATPADQVLRGNATTSTRTFKAAFPFSSHEAAQPYPAMQGKVFFTMAGVDYVCSGTALTSANRSTVWTAGHCVNDGAGTFHTNWAFVPGYRNGSAPYGTWPARGLWTTSGWNGSGDFSYDEGAAVVATNGGQSLTDVVGGRGIAFNYSRSQSFVDYGYPAAPPFDGSKLWVCEAAHATDDTSASPATMGIGCDMTGGSSGGGWTVGNSVYSVNSYGYSNQPNVMYGPYMGTVAQGLYNSAQAG
jgi:V8-like Glu-specific endopeptidase